MKKEIAIPVLLTFAFLLLIGFLVGDACGQERPTRAQQLVPLPPLVSNPEVPKPHTSLWQKVKNNKAEIVLDGLAIGSALFANAGIYHCREHWDVDGCNGQYGHKKSLAIARLASTAAVIPIAHYWKRLDEERTEFGAKPAARSWIRARAWMIIPAAAIGLNMTAGAKAFSHKGDEWMHHNPENP